jgi:hypothetical protein
VQYRRLEALPARPAITIAAAIPVTAGREGVDRNLVRVVRRAVRAADLSRIVELR